MFILITKNYILIFVVFFERIFCDVFIDFWGVKMTREILKIVDELNKQSATRTWLEKPYGLELYAILSAAENGYPGVQNLFSVLRSKTTNLPAFVQFLSRLENDKQIVIMVDECKKSRKIVKLVRDCKHGK